MKGKTMLNNLEYLKNEKEKLETSIIKYGEKISPDSLSLLKNDLEKINEFEKYIDRSIKIEKVFNIILNTTLENIEEKNDFIELLSEKSDVDVFALIKDNPNIESSKMH